MTRNATKQEAANGKDDTLPVTPVGVKAAIDKRGFLPSIDEDDMASDSDAAVPTQQSVKAYTDTQDATFEQQRAQAWVNFDGTGTVSIRDQYNVSSITDNGTGDYTINFSSALNDANYCATAMTNRHGTNARGGVSVNFAEEEDGTGASPAAGSLRVITFAASSSTADATPVDTVRVCVAIFGGN